MRCNIRGVEVECTPEEFKQLTEEQEKKVVVPAKKRRRTQAEMKEGINKVVERVLKGQGMVVAQSIVFGSYSAKRAKKINKIVKKQRKASKPSSSEPDIRVKRMRWIQSRIKQLSKQYGWEYGKAMAFASKEWSCGFKKKFPVLGTHYDKQLESMLKNVVCHETKFTFDMDGEVLDIKDREEWGDLLIKILKRSEDICKYFNAKGKLKIVKLRGVGKPFLKYMV